MSERLTMLIRVCAWCDAVLTPNVTVEDLVDAQLTHGICDECQRKELMKIACPWYEKKETDR
jgi:hypothetical protein